MFGRGMKIYTVHVKPGVGPTQEKPKFVREGFNLYAFMFTGLWLLSQQIWSHAILILLAQFAIGVCEGLGILSGANAVVMLLGIQMVVGLEGNDWLRARLSRQSYVLMDVSAADSLLRAEQRYFERYLAKA